MQENENKAKINPIRETDEDAIALATSLITRSQFASLGVLETSSGAPLVSRVGIAWSKETGLFFLASDLSMHSKCLRANAICSLMLGEMGKGDGLNSPRITLVGSAMRKENEAKDRARFKEVYLQSHPKAKLYIDFLDFGFYPVEVEKGYLNGGFGKAYHLEKTDLEVLQS